MNPYDGEFGNRAEKKAPVMISSDKIILSLVPRLSTKLDQVFFERIP